MQDKFVADVGDFGKYGLLRFLSGMTDEEDTALLRLGVIWYFRHDNHQNTDGKHIGYLNRTPDRVREYRSCDPELWEELRDLIYRDARCVHCVQEASILPKGTFYFSAPIDYANKAKLILKKYAREWWLDYARKAVGDSDLVYLDPDNGIDLNSANMHRKEGPKHVYVDDVKRFWEDNKSLIVYHHASQGTPVAQMVTKVANSFRETMDQDPIVLKFPRGTTRVFFVLPQPRHKELIAGRVFRLLNGPWKKHFTRQSTT